jgi:hypothetical protein
VRLRRVALPPQGSSAGRCAPAARARQRDFESHEARPATAIPKAGSRSSTPATCSYTFKLDTADPHGGARSVRIDNVGPEPFGAIYQHVPAAAHRGRRLRFAAWLRTEDARGSATGGGAVLMLQAMQGGAPLAWNHMKDAPVKGSTAWARHAIELDVPANADQIEVGAMLHGPGRLWLDDVELVVLN